MLRQQMEVLKDSKGRTLYSHVSCEVVIIHKCKKKLVKPRRNEKRCCQELAIWSGDDYKDPAFMKPISREITKVCTPRICNEYDNEYDNEYEYEYDNMNMTIRSTILVHQHWKSG